MSIQCPYCPYSSSQSGPLKIHIRGHTGEKPYRCDYCSYASTCRGNLKVHQERHHKEEIAKHGLNAGIKGPNDYDIDFNTDKRLKPEHMGDVEFEEDLENDVLSIRDFTPAALPPISSALGTTPPTSLSSSSRFCVGDNLFETGCWHN